MEIQRTLVLLVCFLEAFLIYSASAATDTESLPTKQAENYTYTINKTWDNRTTEDDAQIFIYFSLSGDINGSNWMVINVDAPFYNDPEGPPENASVTDPFPGLWDYEVVEAFFLGNDEEYLEIELAPSGHYLLLYLNGVRNATNTTLPLTQYSTQIVNSTENPVKQRWHGEAYIPTSYFPCNVTKFNAYAIHKSDPNRVYMSLFPVAQDEYTEPDFHRLEAFGDISFATEVNQQCGNEGGSNHTYVINRTWNNQTTEDNAEIFISFKLTNATGDSKSMVIEVDAPFYNDPEGPSGNVTDPFPGLWDYEVVEAFFLGNDEEYLEIELAPSGHYLLLYLKGVRNDTNVTLPLTQYSTHILNGTDEEDPSKQRWHGEAHIPASYFPCNVTKFNAYAIHKSDPNRVYMSLFPVSPEEYTEPDFHRLEAFGDISFDSEINPKCVLKGAAGHLHINSALGTIAILSLLFASLFYRT